MTATQRRGASPRRLDQIVRPPDAPLLDVRTVDDTSAEAAFLARPG